MITSQTLSYPVSLTRVQSAARTAIFTSLGSLNAGSITVVEKFAGHSPARVEQFTASAQPELAAVIEIYNPDFYSRVIRGGSIAAAEAYMDGWWDSPNLTVLTRLMAVNMAALDDIERRSGWLKRCAYKIGHWLNRNTQSNSRQNIEAHYDLGNELYETFLDRNMLYSSGIFATAEDSLDQAQINKMERLCQQLQLKPDDHVLEIGTGWGAMAIYMAQRYQCRVTTTTISREQHDYAAEKIAQLGLQDQITLLLEDYRDLSGEYDKLVSVEMIEAVGKQFLGSYIAKCQSLLKPGGILALQAITITDQRYHDYSRSVDFIQKYIFPGGFLPSVGAINQATTRYSNLVLRDLKDIGLDYATTLAHWRLRFEAAAERIHQLGYDERFMRMWRYYLCYCEGGFLARSISTVHMTYQRV